MLRTFSDAAPAPAHPLDVALEEHALVTAGKGIDRHRLVSRVAPEVAGTAKHRRTRPEQRDGRRADDSAEVRNPSVRCYEHGSAGQKVPQLREIEFSCERCISSACIDRIDERNFAPARRPDRRDTPRIQEIGDRSPRVGYST